MLFMVIERFRDNDIIPIYQRLRDSGRSLPDGLEYVDSWVEPNFGRCFQLMRCDDMGPEVMAEVKKLIAWMNARGLGQFETEEGLVGGAAYDAHKVAVTESTMAQALAADAVIFGAVGGPKWDAVPYEARPEAGLLRLRKDLCLFAHLRPAICYPALADASSLKREVVEGLDIMIVRELTGGGYFG